MTRSGMGLMAVVVCCGVWGAAGQGFSPPPIPAVGPIVAPPCSKDCPCTHSKVSYTECWNEKLKNRCDGKIYMCTFVLKSATDKGTCFINGTKANDAKPGTKSCTSRSCNDKSCPDSPAPPITNPCAGKCMNKGKCVIDPKTALPRCYCTNGFSGATCQDKKPGPNTACKTNPCKNGGTCFTTGATGFTCSCPEKDGKQIYFGQTCSVFPCKAGACGTGKCSAPYGKPLCDCTGTGKTGATCAKDVPTNKPCDSTDANSVAKQCAAQGGTCTTKPLYTAPLKARCQCPAGKHGPLCKVAGPASTTCNIPSVMQCVMRARGFDPSTEKGKCDSFNHYAWCASQAKCTDMIQSWCNMYFVQNPNCPVLTKSTGYCQSAPQNGCRIVDYQSCFAQVDRKGKDQDKIANHLASCAAAAGCEQLRYTFCRRTANSGNPDCANVPKTELEDEFAGAEDLPGSEYFYHPGASRSKSTVGAGVAMGCMAVVAVVAALIVLRRRGGTQADGEAPLIELEEA